MRKSTLFSEFISEHQEKQGAEFREKLGAFVIAFERMCETMQISILALLKSQGLSNDSMAHVVIADMTSAPLQRLLGAMYSHLPGQSKEDREAVSEMLREIDKVTELRNSLLHSVWQFPQAFDSQEIEPSASKMHATGKAGAILKRFHCTNSDFDNFISDVKRCQVKLGRFQGCIYNKLSITTEFARMM
jgi:hypothetical protein